MKLSPRVLVVGGIVFAAFMFGKVASSSKEAPEIPMPLILTKVQALGELRTARFTYQHVFEQSSSRTPAQWSRYIPGAESLVLASTRNSALATATAQVDAGIDLSAAKMVDGKIVVPSPTIYRPLIDTRLHHVRSGMLWRDDNLALRATSAMQVRVMRAAKQQGILEEARRNATDVISKVAPGVPVQFEDAQPS